MSPFGPPTLTFPFVFVTSIWYLAGSNIDGLFPVELSSMSLPENHIKRVKLLKIMT